MKSKWFILKNEFFESKKRARSLKEAWDKTLEKWQLRMDGKHFWADVDACGLCNLYYDEDCENCPIMNMTGEHLCEGTFLNSAHDLEYLFLLIVKEATKCLQAHVVP